MKNSIFFKQNKGEETLILPTRNLSFCAVFLFARDAALKILWLYLLTVPFIQESPSWPLPSQLMDSFTHWKQVREPGRGGGLWLYQCNMFNLISTITLGATFVKLLQTIKLTFHNPQKKFFLAFIKCLEFFPIFPYKNYKPICFFTGMACNSSWIPPTSVTNFDVASLRTFKRGVG